MTPSVVILLHLCDSLFPIGSFSHSDGLESATSAGAVRDAADLEHWMDATLATSLRGVDGPGVCAAHRAFTECPGRGDLASILTVLDDELHAMRPSSAGRDASRAMGARLLKTWQHLHANERIAGLLAERTRFTLPTAFGIVTSASGINRQAAVEGFIYTRLAGTVSAAMRLMAIGQHEGHALLVRALARVPAVAQAIVAEPGMPFRSFAPHLDIAAMSQQYVHSRLFRS